ncbi:hypothetical protein KI659_18305 [Litoribacter alkaliphilus]|uniref:Uncharacterized protein n=1 Tax=Litoribacter ruber TaxID=702568 RepID=A0AAP2G2D3_9BACT|nr:hypothetical protein [Litoribacter alkaliphilus]MBS9525979.1 hypothetical protein [Litoribacter alkaliphilus]
MEINKENILSDIGRIPSEVHKNIMYAVVDYAYKYSHVKEIGIGDVKKIVSSKYSEIDILLSLQKLCLLEFPLLELKYEFQDSEDEYYILSNKDIEEAYKTGYLIHPRTGEAMSKEIIQSKVFMFFKVKRS